MPEKSNQTCLTQTGFVGAGWVTQTCLNQVLFLSSWVLLLPWMSSTASCSEVFVATGGGKGCSTPLKQIKLLQSFCPACYCCRQHAGLIISNIRSRTGATISCFQGNICSGSVFLNDAIIYGESWNLQFGHHFRVIFFSMQLVIIFIYMIKKEMHQYVFTLLVTAHHVLWLKSECRPYKTCDMTSDYWGFVRLSPSSTFKVDWCISLALKGFWGVFKGMYHITQWCV